MDSYNPRKKSEDDQRPELFGRRALPPGMPSMGKPKKGEDEAQPERMTKDKPISAPGAAGGSDPGRVERLD